MSRFNFVSVAAARCAALRQRNALVAAAAMLLSAVQPAMAALPAAVAPGAGAAAGDYMALLQQYWKQGIAVLVLMIATVAFYQTAAGAIEKFGEWRMGKAELTDLKSFFFIAVVMLVTVVYLLTTANGIM